VLGFEATPRRRDGNDLRIRTISRIWQLIDLTACRTENESFRDLWSASAWSGRCLPFTSFLELAHPDRIRHMSSVIRNPSFRDDPNGAACFAESRCPSPDIKHLEECLRTSSVIWRLACLASRAYIGTGVTTAIRPSALSITLG
jgi:hypothetical protein